MEACYATATCTYTYAYTDVYVYAYTYMDKIASPIEREIQRYSWTLWDSPDAAPA